ncbi:MAG TPA: hypothetical protein PKX23_14920 [Verrucomicrobiota bacterium]|jgi:hypothetical protein|nr:hypothetical protein [Verrucomicrobiota bacterium]HRT08605.1 hypothetical protein [Candidatus Paceibacterota bacterium]HRT57801.1 hypothetical protein [Candidatus Paceibacterota bacterium]
MKAWFGRKKQRDRDRYYLLPGMGGRALRRKRRMILQWSIATGLIVSAAVACILYFLSTSR